MQNFSPLSQSWAKRRITFALALMVSCWFRGLSAPAWAQSAPVAEELLRCQFVEEEYICTTVKIFDEEALFVIDTGASTTALDTRFQNQLGKPLVADKLVRTPIGDASTSFYTSPVMRIVNGDSDVDLAVPTVAAFDLSFIRSATDQPVAGVIGMDFLKKYVLRLNFDDGYAALVHTPCGTPAEIQRITFDKSGTPSVRLRISDDNFHDIFLDSGSNLGLELEHVLFRKLTKKRRIVVEGGLLVVAAGGFANSQPGTLDQVELGNIRLRNVDVSTSQRSKAGLKFLERFEAEFDFPNRKAYFRPGKRLHNPPRTNLSRFACKIVDDKLVVVGCRGMAQDAGVRVGDILVKINGHPAREMTISAFRSLQCRPDTELNLRFERADESFDVSLKLKQSPNPFPDDTEDMPNER